MNYILWAMFFVVMALLLTAMLLPLWSATNDFKQLIELEKYWENNLPESVSLRDFRFDNWTKWILTSASLGCWAPSCIQKRIEELGRLVNDK